MKSSVDASKGHAIQNMFGKLKDWDLKKKKDFAWQNCENACFW